MARVSIVVSISLSTLKIGNLSAGRLFKLLTLASDIASYEAAAAFKGNDSYLAKSTSASLSIQLTKGMASIHFAIQPYLLCGSEPGE